MNKLLQEVLEETRVLSQNETVPYERYVKLVEMRQNLTNDLAQIILSQEEKRGQVLDIA